MAPDDEDAQAATMVLLAASGLFDAAHYLADYPDVRAAGCDPLAHFCRHGFREGRNPNPYFHTAWYLRDNPDVARTGCNPLAHYAQSGERAGSWPSRKFDPAWYRRFAGLDPAAPALAHFLARCRGDAAAPAAFDAAAYLRLYPDVAASGVDPFAHFVLEGAAEGRTAGTDAAVIGPSGLFDPSFYLLGSPDVGECGDDALAHFCAYGWREGRRPNPYFDPAWYRHAHLAGRHHPVNPLTHYVREGEAADLRPCAWFDTAWYRRRHRLGADASPLRHFLRRRRSQRVSPTPLFDVAFYLRTYGNLIGPNRDPFAHFLVHGARRDLDPAPDFNSADYRREHMADRATGGEAVEAANPLVHFLLRRRAALDPSAMETHSAHHDNRRRRAEMGDADDPPAVAAATGRGAAGLLRETQRRPTRRVLQPRRRRQPAAARPAAGPATLRHVPHGPLLFDRAPAGPAGRGRDDRPRHGVHLERPPRRGERRVFLGHRRRRADRRHQAGLRPRLRAAGRVERESRRPSRCRSAAGRHLRHSARAVLGRRARRRCRTVHPRLAGLRRAIAARTPTCTSRKR